MGQGENHVKVRHGQEVGLTSGQPGRPLGPTTLRAASVATGMIVIPHLAAVIALSDVPAQGRRAAQRQVPERLPHMGALWPALQEVGSILPHDLPQAQGLVAWPGAGGRRSSGLTTCCIPAQAHVRVQSRGPDPMMAQQGLDRAGVDSRFQEMRGMAVAQGVRSDPRQPARGRPAGRLSARSSRSEAGGDPCPETSIASASSHASTPAAPTTAVETAAPAVPSGPCPARTHHAAAVDLGRRQV